MKISTQIYIFIITVLAVVVYIQCGDGYKGIYCTENKTIASDTVVIFRTDTIIEYAVKYKERKVTDTVYIETQNKPFLALSVVSKHFAKENLYDAWVSGYKDVFMDSIKVYPKTEYKTITNTNIVEVYPKTWGLYANVGFSHFNGTFIPKVGVSIKNKKETLYGAEIGSYGDDLYIGVNVGFKINK